MALRYRIAFNPNGGSGDRRGVTESRASRSDAAAVRGQHRSQSTRRGEI